MVVFVLVYCSTAQEARQCSRVIASDNATNIASLINLSLFDLDPNRINPTVCFLCYAELGKLNKLHFQLSVCLLVVAVVRLHGTCNSDNLRAVDSLLICCSTSTHASTFTCICIYFHLLHFLYFYFSEFSECCPLPICVQIVVCRSRNGFFFSNLCYLFFW